MSYVDIYIDKTAELDKTHIKYKGKKLAHEETERVDVFFPSPEESAISWRHFCGG